MKQDPILLKDLIEAAKHLPDPNSCSFDEISIVIKEDQRIDNPRQVMFKKWARITQDKTEFFWVIWHTIAIR